MRLEGMAGLRHADDPELSDVDLRSRVVHITAKGRREQVLPKFSETGPVLSDVYVRVLLADRQGEAFRNGRATT
jgi:site-specific recombinase XerC